ncbi:MAG: hypothetical protein KF874_05775 [Rhizobiaceae bacterium]|nr:hypothetical protein [Rhizobiaceae bacterium]
MTRVTGFASILALLLVQGCASIGGVAVSGAASDSVISALGGGLIGGKVGRDLPSGDRRLALQAEYRALEYGQGGQVIPWNSSNGANRGEVVAAQPYRVGSQDCRQYVHTLFTANASQSARGTACRNPDGSWSLLG